MEKEELVSDRSDEKDKIVGDDHKKDEHKSDTVDYKTHKRLLSQHKESQKKAKELEDQLKELSEFKEKHAKAEEAKLREEGNWTKLLEQREEKISSLSEQLQKINEENDSYKKNLDDMIKLNAFQSALGGRLKKDEYFSFVDTDKIVINPETREIDRDSLSKYANEFTNSFKELIEFSSAKLPDGAPKGSSSLTLDEWRKLPYKEKIKRQVDVKL